MACASKSGGGGKGLGLSLPKIDPKQTPSPTEAISDEASTSSTQRDLSSCSLRAADEFEEFCERLHRENEMMAKKLQQKEKRLRAVNRDYERLEQTHDMTVELVRQLRSELQDSDRKSKDQQKRLDKLGEKETDQWQTIAENSLLELAKVQCQFHELFQRLIEKSEETRRLRGELDDISRMVGGRLRDLDVEEQKEAVGVKESNLEEEEEAMETEDGGASGDREQAKSDLLAGRRKSVSPKPASTHPRKPCTIIMPDPARAEGGEMLHEEGFVPKHGGKHITIPTATKSTSSPTQPEVDLADIAPMLMEAPPAGPRSSLFSFLSRRGSADVEKKKKLEGHALPPLRGVNIRASQSLVTCKESKKGVNKKIHLPRRNVPKYELYKEEAV